ncbi:MAG: hypothetical protein ACPIOQ_01365 [Promethearchaeia archaeon]
MLDDGRSEIGGRPAKAFALNTAGGVGLPREGCGVWVDDQETMNPEASVASHKNAVLDTCARLATQNCAAAHPAGGYVCMVSASAGTHVCSASSAVKISTRMFPRGGLLLSLRNNKNGQVLLSFWS